MMASPQVQGRPGQVTADMMAGLGGAAGKHISLWHVRTPMHAIKSRTRKKVGVKR